MDPSTGGAQTKSLSPRHPPLEQDDSDKQWNVWLRYRQRREAELSLDRVENELTEVSNRFLAEIPVDLIRGLLD